MNKVITYRSRDSEFISLTKGQIKALESAGAWPRTERGHSYSVISRGLNDGKPTYTDEQIRTMCKQAQRRTRN